MRRRWYFSYPLLAAIGLAIGYGIFVGFIPQPKVAIINVAYAELYGDTAAEIDRALKFVREDNSIRAVVIRLNSPGGSVTASADVFLNTVKVREKKPVVVLIGDIAASGGYMWLLGANYVYANPTSVVGNVGAIMFLPGTLRPFEDIIPTGPFKLTGGSQRNYISMLEAIKDIFIETAFSQRGDRLRLSRDELAEGRIYFGWEASRLGLVDALGTESDAVAKAAELARIRNYTLVDVNEELKKQGTTLSFSRYATYNPSSLKVQFPYIHYFFWEPR